MEGLLTYTQHSVAFPEVPRSGRPHIMDEVGIHADANGGGVHAEFYLRWMDLGRVMGRDEPWSLHFDIFNESMPLFLDARVQAVVALCMTENDPQPAKVVEWLDAAGFYPTRYHLEGLAKQPGLTDERRAWIQRRMQIYKAHVGDG